MKKSISLSTLLILVLFITMGCGCEKDPVEPDYPMEITTQTLDGKWDFVSLTVPLQGTLTECDQLLPDWPGWVGLVFRSYDFNSTAGTVDVTDKCAATPYWDDLSFSMTEFGGDEYIVIEGESHLFTYDNVAGELDLQIQDPDGGGYLVVKVKKQ